MCHFSVSRATRLPQRCRGNGAARHYPRRVVMDHWSMLSGLPSWAVSCFEALRSSSSEPGPGASTQVTQAFATPGVEGGVPERLRQE